MCTPQGCGSVCFAIRAVSINFQINWHWRQADWGRLSLLWLKYSKLIKWNSARWLGIITHIFSDRWTSVTILLSGRLDKGRWCVFHYFNCVICLDFQLLINAVVLYDRIKRIWEFKKRTLQQDFNSLYIWWIWLDFCFCFQSVSYIKYRVLSRCAYRQHIPPAQTQIQFHISKKLIHHNLWIILSPTHAIAVDTDSIRQSTC